MPRLHSLNLSNSSHELTGIISNDDAINGRIKSAVFRHHDFRTDLYLDRERCQRFIEVIAGFKHLQFLKVRIEGNPDPEHHWNTKALIESLSNLKGLDFDDASKGIEWSILQSVGHRLEYLTLYDPEEHFLHSAEQKQIDFVNLRQLWQDDGCVSDCIRIIMKTAVHLEKVRLPDQSPLLGEVLSKCEELKYLEIDVVETWGYGSFNDVLQTMERSLFTKMNRQRQSLKIKINTSFTAIANDAESKNHIITLNRLIKSFSENNVDQWMLIIHIKRKEKEGNGELLHHLARSLTSDICSTTVLDCENYIAALITNPDCTICGWRESWLMSP